MRTFADLVPGHEPKPDDPTSPEYIERYLVHLPPTDRLEHYLERMQAQFETSKRPRDAEEIRLLEQQLGWARQRDAIQATRPEGCQCLGLGGREKRYTALGEPVWRHPCQACPEGEAAAADRERLREVIEAEREEQLRKRRFLATKVPSRFHQCTFETYPVSPGTQAAFDAVKLWVRGPDDDDDDVVNAWADARKRSIMLHGPFGVGKTGLAVSAFREYVESEGRGLFFTVPDLLDAIRATFSPNSEADERQIIREVKEAPVLVLDDLGAERVTDWVREKLFTVINYRHDEDLPTIFTSNLDVAQLGDHIGERTTWRIVEMCQVIKVDGPNLRDRS